MVAVHHGVRGLDWTRGIVEEGAYVIVQASLVAFQGKDVVAALGHHFGGNGALAVECVSGHDAPDTVGEWVRRKVESGVGAVISGCFAMSLHPQQLLLPVPEQTARIA